MGVRLYLAGLDIISIDIHHETSNELSTSLDEDAVGDLYRLKCMEMTVRGVSEDSYGRKNGLVREPPKKVRFSS